jgi:hypothetical protein
MLQFNVGSVNFFSFLKESAFSVVIVVGKEDVEEEGRFNSFELMQIMALCI